MDQVVSWPVVSCTSPSPAYFSTAPLLSSEALERWLGSDDCLDDDAGWGDQVEDSHSASHDNIQSAGSGAGQPPAPAPPKRRGRKPRPAGTNGPVLSHVEAEQKRRDNLNRRFCELRAAVPRVTRMDRASLLVDAAGYIAELRDHIEQLEAEAKQAATTTTSDAAAVAAAVTCSATPTGGTHSSLTSFGGFFQENLEVRMVGQDAAMLRLTTSIAASHAHAPACFMLALRSLDLPVQRACVCRVGDVTVQDAVVDVPAAMLRDEHGLRAALLHSLQWFARG